VGNRAPANGGGISTAGILTLTNSTVSGNDAIAGSGGGIASWGLNGQVDMAFCTIYGNTAHRGGGLSIENAIGLKPHQIMMGNSISAGNHATSGPEIVGILTTDGYNLIQNVSDATFNDPLNKHATDILGGRLSDLSIAPSLQDNGGPTLTHKLLPGSPAIDYIPIEACYLSGISTDQRGMKRPDDGEDKCDIGAYEYVDSPT